MSDREIVRRLVVRILVVIAFALGVPSALFGLDVDTHANWFLGALALLLLPGALVWRAPRLGSALLWSMWTIFVATMLFLGTLDVAHPFGVAMFGLLVHLVAVIPFTCAVAWFVTRERTQRPVLPIARAVR